jgi:hypothetical protein
MAVLTLNTNGTGLQTLVPYGELVSDSCVKKEAVGTYIDTNSERITNVAATPAHTKRNPYTAPAGPPLCKYRQYICAIDGRDQSLLLVCLQEKTMEYILAHVKDIDISYESRSLTRQFLPK